MRLAERLTCVSTDIRPFEAQLVLGRALRLQVQDLEAPTALEAAEVAAHGDEEIGQAALAADRLVSTPAGDVELRIPKLRKGSYSPALLKPRRRVDRAL